MTPKLHCTFDLHSLKKLELTVSERLKLISMDLV